MANTKIVVLGGGNSSEREVSLRSASAVDNALKDVGYETVEIDPKDGLQQLNNLKDVIVFPILHGKGGEDGVIQEALEKMELPYLGTNSEASKICFDKSLTRKKLIKAGIAVADGDSVNADNYLEHPLSKTPHVLKVTRGGSSIGTYLVRDPSKIDEDKVSDVFKLDNMAIIERLLEGKEITVPILDNEALPVIEIVPPEGGEFDYENKYNGKTKEHCPPLSVDKETQYKAQQLALKVHKALGARHLSRVDIIVDQNDLYVLELNTIPGMTGQSLYPRSAQVHGLSMSELMSEFVRLVKRDYKLN